MMCKIVDVKKAKEFAEKHPNFKIIAWKYIEPFGRYS